MVKHRIYRSWSLLGVLSLRGKFLGKRGWDRGMGVTGVASSSFSKLPLCPLESMSAGSQTDVLLAKAESISDGGNVFKTEGKKNL